MRRLTIGWAAGSLLWLAAAGPALAHEQGIVRLARSEVPAGSTLAVRGEKLPKATALRLELRGALATVALGEVRTDSAGVFGIQRALPPEADPGRYQLVALAPDGDVVARADLVVLEAPPAAAAMEHDAAGSGAAAHDGAAAPEATDEAMELPVTYSAAEWAIIAALLLAAAAGGAVLLRGGRDPHAVRGVAGD